MFITDVSETVLAECPENWLKTAGDASDPAHVRDVFARIATEWGGIDVVCANAGIAGPTALVEDVEPDDFRPLPRRQSRRRFPGCQIRGPDDEGTEIRRDPYHILQRGDQRLPQPRTLCGGEMGG